MEAAELKPLDETPAPAAALSRPETCKAALDEDLMICERCGLDWPAGTAGPKCSPITFETLRDRMLSQIIRAEASLISVQGLASRRMPTDGGRRARRCIAELKAVLRLVERIAGDDALKAMLNGKKA